MNNSTPKISINAAIKYRIERILHHNNKEIPEYFLTKETFLDNDNSKEEIINLLSQCESFSFDENGIVITIKRTPDELAKYLEEKAYNLTCQIKQLKKWFDSKPENKEQITQYLKFKELQWILHELN